MVGYLKLSPLTLSSWPLPPTLHHSLPSYTPYKQLHLNHPPTYIVFPWQQSSRHHVQHSHQRWSPIIQMNCRSQCCVLPVLPVMRHTLEQSNNSVRWCALIKNHLEEACPDLPPALWVLWNDQICSSPLKDVVRRSHCLECPWAQSGAQAHPDRPPPWQVMCSN